MKCLRLTLRDLFWLTLVVAMGCAYGLRYCEVRRLRSDSRDAESWRQIAEQNHKDAVHLRISMQEAIEREGYVVYGAGGNEVKIARKEDDTGLTP